MRSLPSPKASWMQWCRGRGWCGCAAGVSLIIATMWSLTVWMHGQQPGPSLPTPTLPATAKQHPPAVLRLIGKALDPELMAHVLPEGTQYNTTYKNPCWTAPTTGQLQCMPYVYVAGSFQSGAASLCAKLSEHQDVITNDVSRWQFWGEDPKPAKEFVSKHSSERTVKQLKASPGSKVILDGSASTFAFYWSAGLRAHRAFQSVMVPCWQECSQASRGNKADQTQCVEEQCHPRAMSADLKVAEGLGLPYDALHVPLLMAAAYGEGAKPKLIVLMRHPLDRVHAAYFQYQHYHTKYGRHAEGFLDYVKQQVGAMQACATRFTGQLGGPLHTPMDATLAMRHCALYFEALGPSEEQVFFHADQFIRGMYAIFLEVWFRHLPRDNILVLRSETFFADPDTSMHRVYRFLGLNTPTDEKTMRAVQSAGQPRGSLLERPAMHPEAVRIMLDFYKPWNDQLSSLLNDPQWLEYNAYAATP